MTALRFLPAAAATPERRSLTPPRLSAALGVALALSGSSRASVAAPGRVECGPVAASSPSDGGVLPFLTPSFQGAGALLGGPLGVPAAQAGEPVEVLYLRAPGGLIRLPHPYARAGQAGAVTPGPLGAVVVLPRRRDGRAPHRLAGEAAAEWARLVLDRSYGHDTPWLESGLGSVVATTTVEAGRAVLPGAPFSAVAKGARPLVPPAELDRLPWEPQRDPTRWLTAWVLIDTLVRDPDGVAALREWLATPGARPPLGAWLALALPDVQARLRASVQGSAPPLDLGPVPACRSVPADQAERAAREAVAAASLLRAKGDGRLRGPDRARVAAAGKARDSGGSGRTGLAWLRLTEGRWAEAAELLHPMLGTGDRVAAWLAGLAERRARTEVELAGDPAAVSQVFRHWSELLSSGDAPAAARRDAVFLCTARLPGGPADCGADPGPDPSGRRWAPVGLPARPGTR